MCKRTGFGWLGGGIGGRGVSREESKRERGKGQEELGRRGVSEGRGERREKGSGGLRLKDR